MTSAALSDLMGLALDSLVKKDASMNAAYALKEKSGLLADRDRRVLEFQDPSGSVYLTAHVVYIGTYLDSLNSWRWAWASDSFPSEARAESSQLKELTASTNDDMFSTEFLDDVLPSMTWELTALAVQHLGALGSYRYGSEPAVFVAIVGVQRVLQ